MMYQCPYDHSNLPLPLEVQQLLEQKLLALLLGTSHSSTSMDHGYSSLSTNQSIELFLDPVINFFLPWQPIFATYLATYPHLAGRIAHQIFHHLADLLESTGLFSQIMDMSKEAFTLTHGSDPPNPEATQEPYRASNLEELAYNHLFIHQKTSELLDRLTKSVYRICVRTLPRFLDSMVELAKHYRFSEDMMRDYLGAGLGWDLEPSTWTTDELINLKDLAEFLNQEPDFHDLINRLGKTHQPFPLDNKDQSATPVITALGKQEILGLSFGKDLEALVPSSLALAADARGMIRFQMDYAQEQLPQFSYQSFSTSGNQSPDPPQNPKGPFILCLDTSGSMTGFPELAAKAITLSALQQASSLERSVVLLGFSHKLTQLVWEPPYPMKELLEFLSRPFNGGTDLRPAIEASVTFIRQGDYQGADLLILSDFRIPKIMIKKSQKLRNLQEEYRTKIHALTVGTEPIVDDYNLFDSCWICWPDHTRPEIPSNNQGHHPRITQTFR
jgi:uncharacterized protein with von Willebrand factor type A (vWA) domain